SELENSREFFERATRALSEEDSTFQPVSGAMTVAQQVAHVAHTVHWFIDGAGTPEGFDLDFEAHANAVGQVTWLAAAREQFTAAYDRAIAYYGGLGEAELTGPLPEGMVMGGEPRYRTVSGIVEHSAHHRGSLSVYTRLL